LVRYSPLTCSQSNIRFSNSHFRDKLETEEFLKELVISIASTIVIYAKTLQSHHLELWECIQKYRKRQVAPKPVYFLFHSVSMDFQSLLENLCGTELFYFGANDEEELKNKLNSIIFEEKSQGMNSFQVIDHCTELIKDRFFLTKSEPDKIEFGLEYIVEKKKDASCLTQEKDNIACLSFSELDLIKVDDKNWILVVDVPFCKDSFFQLSAKINEHNQLVIYGPKINYKPYKRWISLKSPCKITNRCQWEGVFQISLEIDFGCNK